jgi:hypothetical protein
MTNNEAIESSFCLKRLKRIRSFHDHLCLLDQNFASSCPNVGPPPSREAKQRSTQGTNQNPEWVVTRAFLYLRSSPVEDPSSPPLPLTSPIFNGEVFVPLSDLKFQSHTPPINVISSRISLSGTARSQLHSPAKSIFPLHHRNLYGDRV